jgi:tRNA(Ile)-lysidine synthase
MPATKPRPVSPSEGRALFAPYAAAPALVLAVSGGPDSMALLHLAAQWRKARRRGPVLIAVTVDHGLRRDSPAEARDVKRVAQSLGVAHVTKRWRGDKPATGLPAAARAARYALLVDAARAAQATHILTAHTQDDQAETVLMRLLRGSGVTGLAGMAETTPLGSVVLARPFLVLPKARLIATLARAHLRYASDPTNADPTYLRPRLRALLPSLAAEGLDARGLSRLAARMARADIALEAATDAADSGDGFDALAFGRLPLEIRIRLLQRAIARNGQEGAAGLAQVEALAQAIAAASATGERMRRTLAGALISLAKGRLVVSRAPPRRLIRR